jgi:peptidoglycan/xylan/chitin deacetylase (PgdA/CDA1 family)
MKKNQFIITLFIIILLLAFPIESHAGNKGKKQKSEAKIPVLMYHHLSYDDPKGNPSITSPDKFRAELELLKDRGYTTIFFKDYINHIESGAPLPEKPIIITFDDGYYSNFQYAFPILKELEMKATISIIGWSMGREYHKDNVTKIIKHFSWEEAKIMYDSGLIDIQHHSFDLHDNKNGVKGVSKMPGESKEDYFKRFVRDTLLLKTLIQTKIGNEVIVYTYPYGKYNETTEKLLRKMGFKATLSVQKGVSDFNTSLYGIKRYNMAPNVSSEKIINELERKRTGHSH